MSVAGTERRCGSCGSPLAPGAAFCRRCGTRYEPPAAAPPPSPGRDGRHRALWLGAAVVLLGAGAALAILLAGGGTGAGTTVVVAKGSGTAADRATGSGSVAEHPETGAGSPAAAPEAIEAGRYVQAGSFKTASHAEEERERLAAAGVDVTVVSSDGAAELYPDFQVLVAGPIANTGEEKSLLVGLHRNGVPSAFARPLSPAPRLAGPGEAVGRWSGTLERTSVEHPDLDGSLPVRLEIDAGGRSGRLERGNCSAALTLAESGPATLSYSQPAPCIGGGTLTIRPTQGQLMLSLLPPGNDVLTLGTLSPG